MQTGTARHGNELLKVPALHKDGGTLSIAFTVVLPVDKKRAVSGIAAVIRDETARFEAERLLARRLAELE